MFWNDFVVAKCPNKKADDANSTRIELAKLEKMYFCALF
jgi:hypothetical protein